MAETVEIVEIYVSPPFFTNVEEIEVYVEPASYVTSEIIDVYVGPSVFANVEIIEFDVLGDNTPAINSAIDTQVETVYLDVLTSGATNLETVYLDVLTSGATNLETVYLDVLIEIPATWNRWGYWNIGIE